MAVSLAAERRRLREGLRETVDHAWQEYLRLEGLWSKDPSCPSAYQAMRRAHERYEALRAELDSHFDETSPASPPPASG